jgi:ribonuclease BN (tRNA processing enzyme)
MNLILCGVRGSTPAPGLGFHLVGGHTSCLAIEAGDGRLLVLDAGTGFRRLSTLLDGAPLRASVLLTHLHWDHVQGLPFLPNADRPDAEVALYVPAQGYTPALELLGRAMSPPHFPIDPTGLRGDWSFHSLDTGTHEIEGLQVTAAAIAHKGGRTFGYRVSDGQTSVAYLPDHAPNIATPTELADALELTSGVDLLLHDAQFVASERSLADLFAHATIDDCVGFARDAGVGALALIHHSPVRIDDDVEAIGAGIGDVGFPVLVGHEGDRLTIRSGQAPART